MTTVLLVDDAAMLRTGFQMILSVEPDLEVIGQASNGAEAVELCTQLRPDVVLMDVQMPVMDGIEATAQIVSGNLSKVIILTTFDRDDYLFDALRAGASGFLLKNADPDDLVEAIRHVADGRALLSPDVTLKVIAQLAGQSGSGGHRPRAAELERLTEREREVLGLVARGLSNAEIAQDLWVGEATVKTHVSNVLAKLQLRDRVQAVVFAYEAGAVHPGE